MLQKKAEKAQIGKKRKKKKDQSQSAQQMYIMHTLPSIHSASVQFKMSLDSIKYNGSNCANMKGNPDVQPASASRTRTYNRLNKIITYRNEEKNSAN